MDDSGKQLRDEDLDSVKKPYESAKIEEHEPLEEAAATVYYYYTYA